MTSSFDVNFFPLSHFFKFGNKKKLQGAKSGKYPMDAPAIRSAIRPIWLWRLRRSEPVHCEQSRHPSGRQLFHSQVIMQNIECHSVRHGLCYFMHFRSAISENHVMDFFDSSITTSAGRPGRSSSKIDERSRLNSLNQYLTVVIDGEEFP